MSSYDPLDITPWANFGPELFSHGEKFVDESWHPPSEGYPLGEQTFRGLHFCIGKAGAHDCLVYFGPDGYRQPIELAIDCSPKWLVVAHRLLETRLYTGEAVGKQVAFYRFRYANGREIECPIRERLEISVAPPRWGQLPLRSEPDQKESLADRESGPWNCLGWRLTEVGLAWPRWFVLWAWKNPHPEMPLVALRVEPGDRPFFIAAITASNLDEDPIGRSPKKTITIQLKNPPLVGNWNSCSISVDRGQVGYSYPLPEKPVDEYLQDHMPGFGQLNDPSGTTIYTQVVAQPSATLQVKHEMTPSHSPR